MADYRLALEWVLNELGYHPHFKTAASFGKENSLLHSHDIITVPQHEIEYPFNPAKHFLLKMEALNVKARHIDVKGDGIPDKDLLLSLLEKGEKAVVLIHDDPHAPKGSSGRYYVVAWLDKNGKWWSKQGIAGTPCELDLECACKEWGQPPMFFAIQKKAP